MDTLLKNELKALMEKSTGPCVSIYLPTDRTGMETEQDQLRLRNQLREVEKRLQASGLRSTAIQEMLEPFQKLLTNSEFWGHQSDELAFFCSPEVFCSYRLPLGFEDVVVVANHFHLKPLLPFFTGDGRFYVLALSQNEIRLLQGMRYSMSEVELPEKVPESLAEALKYDDPQNETQFHSGTSSAPAKKGERQRQAAIFHGHGVGIDESKDNILRYFRQIDRGLQELLRGEQAPLVLAGVEYLFPIYREANTYAHLLDQGIAGNPDKLSAGVLHELAWAVVRPYFQKAQQDAAEQYSLYSNTDRTSNDVGEILPEASYGRVGLLFVALDWQEWGTFDPAANMVHLHREEMSGDEDLLSLAAIQTILHGGTVYAVGSGKVPGGGPIAAVYRY